MSCLFLSLFFLWSTAFAQSDGCMGVPDFSTWTNIKPHPYRPTSDRAAAIQRGYKLLRLGMTLEQARSLVPGPDWAEDDWKGCTWHYAMSLGRDGLTEKSFTIRFGGDVVNGLGRARLSVSKHSKFSQN